MWVGEETPPSASRFKKLMATWGSVLSFPGRIFPHVTSVTPSPPVLERAGYPFSAIRHSVGTCHSLLNGLQ